MDVFFSSLLLSVVFVLLLLRYSIRFGLVDHPGGRKQHSSPTPTVGGLAMFIAVMLALYLGDAYNEDNILLVKCAGLLVVLGVLDDRHDLPVGMRMMAQVFLVLVVIIGADGAITHLGALFGGKDIHLGLLAIPFTVVAFVGSINAMNMIDGADGMAGKMSLITTLGSAVIFYLSGAAELMPLSWAMLGALLGFLIFNMRLFVQRAWVFMGDAGSMWVGLVLGWFMLQITRGAVSAEPALVLWLFGIPLIDTLVVMLRRAKHRRSPFHADRTHIHYLLAHMGLPTKRNVWVLSLVQLILVTIGVIFYLTQAPAWLVFWSFALLVVFYYFLFHNARTGDRRKNTAGLGPGLDDRRQHTGGRR
ncbi:MAG: undecaprenyl/decaprenyl-phosphate alpha-N-acetylglucosaminyl 1-phosphate transferase [Gallionella sp.]|nr:undecaprenyl/decaprenyl-phosphate alpha-N-acetylglucosaminyl 1-phosphate transferase [Gallionella sp.]